MRYIQEERAGFRPCQVPVRKVEQDADALACELRKRSQLTEVNGRIQ